MKNLLKKCMAMVLLCAVTVTSIPLQNVRAAETSADKELVLHYDFESLGSGTIVNDISGNGQNGVVRPEGSGVETEKVSILGQNHTAFVMNGGQPDETHTYVEMPQGILNGLEDVTISCWVYVDSLSSGYQRIWDIGSDTTSYMYLLVNGYNEGHVGYTGAITASGWSNEKGPQKGEALEAGRWILTTLTFDGSEKEMSLYEDATLIGTAETEVDLSVLKDSTQNWIGYGMFGNDILSGKVADFKIYNYALTAEEVAATFAISDEERVARDKAALTLGNITAVTEDIVLPTKGEVGSAITWKSSNEAVISSAGKVTRPEAGKGNALVTLTATITSNKYSEEKVFEVNVSQKLTAREIVENDAAELTLGNLSSVAENLTLPIHGELGSAITWASSNEDVIAVDGTVKRPVGKAETVVLTATISYGNESKTVEFTATVVPGYEKKDIVLVEDISIESAIGTLPNLPGEVYVVYEDDTAGTEKVVWPKDLSVDDFSKTGTYTVDGEIIDKNHIVTANVTVVDKVEAPEKAAESFELDNIILNGADTIYAENKDRAMEYLKIMDADRMLYNFRATFGQDTKGARALTGWDEPSGLLRGHSTGHFLSALALAYASSGDEEYKEKLDYMIAEMRKLQLLSKGNPEDFETTCTPASASQNKWSTDPGTWGEGFISAYSPDQFALLEQYTPYATIWAPYYTLHKLIAGFIDCYNYAGNEEALEIAKDLGTWVYRRLDACTQEQRETMWSMYIAGEYGGMNESLARLYEITGDATYLEAAKMFDNAEFFDGLAVNVDTIQNRHANQHIPQIVGAIHEYAATGDEYYYNVAKNFWEMVISRYAYSIGGVGTGERFKDPYEQGANILGNAGRGENCETCAAYNMLKLTMELHNYDPDNAAYMDYYERTLINQIAASQSHDTTSYMHNGVTYMLPVDPGQRKSYDSDYGGFTCCNGTGMENHVKYQEAAYAHSEDTLYVNLYMPTTVNWEEKDVSIVQETEFPSEYSKLTVEGSGEFNLKLRVPYWATEEFKVSVNGEVLVENPEVSTYFEISRSWKSGDVVEINMPYTLHLDKTPDKVDGKTVASIMYGPLVMVAKDDRSTYVPMNWYELVLGDELSETIDVVTGADAEEVPHLVTNGLHFYPMYDAYNYRYHVYVKLEETVSVLNTEKLEEIVDSVTGDNALKEENYSAEDWKAYEEALAKAQEMLGSKDVTQTQIYEAYKNLQTVINGMEIVDPVCTHTQVEHEIVEATCVETGTKTTICSTCGETVSVETLPVSETHAYGSWKVKSKANVFKAEVQVRKCTVSGCTASETRSVGKPATKVLKLPGNLKSITMKAKTSSTFKITMGTGDSIVSCKSSKSSVVKVNYAKASGTCKITAGKVAKNKKATAYLTFKLKSGMVKMYKVTVSNNTVKTTSVSNVASKVTLNKNKTYQLKPVRTPFTSTQKLTYKTSNKKVATVNSTGKITAKAAGKATITVTSGTKKKKIVVTVKGIGGLKSSYTMKRNKTLKLSPIRYGITSKVTYTSSKPSVASVSSTGKVTSKKKGTTYITVKSGSYSVKCKVVVK